MKSPWVDPEFKIKVYPGVSDLWSPVIPDHWRPPADGEKRYRKPRGKIQEFSFKSRKRLQKKIAMTKKHPDFWVDFTFADDVMAGKSITERSVHATQSKKRFNEALRRKGLHEKIHGVWKKEWQPRKSGDLIGQDIPHFHNLFSIDDPTCEPYSDVAYKMMDELLYMWVAATQTGMVSEALSVALHPKSKRFITSHKQARTYINKGANHYVAKSGEFKKEDDSIGRSYGNFCQPLPQAEPVIFDLSVDENRLLRRVVRGCLKSRARHFVSKMKEKLGEKFGEKYKSKDVKRMLGRGRLKWLFEEEGRCFPVYIHEDTIERMLQWVFGRAEQLNLVAVPF